MEFADFLEQHLSDVRLEHVAFRLQWLVPDGNVGSTEVEAVAILVDSSSSGESST